jgi:hypothetical protein
MPRELRGRRYERSVMARGSGARSAGRRSGRTHGRSRIRDAQEYSWAASAFPLTTMMKQKAY